jgi:pimeloyl-ACP methyl ester carboxylesterase
MKISLSRRVTAVVAALGLALVAVPAAAPAANADGHSCGLGQVCTGALSGSLGDSMYQIRMPAKFNGTVLLYSHGYRIAQPVPAAIGKQLRMDQSPYYSPTTTPGVGPTYTGNDLPQVGPSAEVIGSLLNQGYALAGAGYARQGWAVAEGVEAGENLIKLINSGGIKGTKQIMAWGNSMGAEVTQALVQRNPGKIAGTLPQCGALAGFEQAMESAMTVVYTWKTLVDPSIKGANYAPGKAGYAEAVTDLSKIAGTIATVKATDVSPAGYPTVFANFLAGLMAGLPTVSPTYDGVTVNPAVATLGLGGALAGGYSPVSSNQSAIAAMLQNVFAASALGVMGRYEMEQRVRLAGSLGAGENANFTSNVGVDYGKLLSPEERGLWGDAFAAAGPGVLDAMLAALAAGDRFAANPVAQKIVSSLPSAEATYNNKPIVLLTDTYDPITPDGNAGGFYDGVVMSKKGKKAEKKGMLKAVSYYAVPPADGWTSFEEGAKSPSDLLSAVKLGGSGVGHCAFTTDQTVAAVKVLAALADAKSAKKVAAAKRLGYKVPGINKDRQYEPPALKNPAATVG